MRSVFSAGRMEVEVCEVHLAAANDVNGEKRLAGGQNDGGEFEVDGSSGATGARATGSAEL